MNNNNLSRKKSLRNNGRNNSRRNSRRKKILTRKKLLLREKLKKKRRVMLIQEQRHFRQMKTMSKTGVELIGSLGEKLSSNTGKFNIGKSIKNSAKEYIQSRTRDHLGSLIIPDQSQNQRSLESLKQNSEKDPHLKSLLDKYQKHHRTKKMN